MDKPEQNSYTMLTSPRKSKGTRQSQESKRQNQQNQQGNPGSNLDKAIKMDKKVKTKGQRKIVRLRNTKQNGQKGTEQGQADPGDSSRV